MTCALTGKTMEVNVGGTKTVLDALKKKAVMYSLSFSSSVSTYGWTTEDTLPIKIDHPRWAWTFTLKARSKPKKLFWHPVFPTFLRITGVVIPQFYDPNPWQFLRTRGLSL